MPTSTPPTDPDTLAVLHALTAAGVPPEDAYDATQGISNMAAANLIARFESKLDALRAEQGQRLAEQDAKLTAVDTKLRMLLWMVPVAMAVIGILIRVLG